MKQLKLNYIRHFIIDECDKVLDNLGKLLQTIQYTIFKVYSITIFMVYKTESKPIYLCINSV